MDRSRTDGPDVRLFVVVLRAEQPSGLPPLVMLHGGPGLSAMVPMVRGAMQQAPLDRDMVFYDQRGAGLSEPDPCPDYADRVGQLQASDPVGSTDRVALQVAARECVASMRARGIDPAAFSTTANAADLADLRRALAYEHWDLYGGSYGARLALEAMRRDGEGVRAAVLEDPAPPDFESADAPLATQHALERVFAACTRSAACKAAFPSLEQTFLAVFDTLSRTPVAEPATNAGSPPMALDGEGFVLAIRRVLRSTEGIASLPLLLHELHGGDRARAARELLRMAGAGRATRAVFWLVQCYDQYGPAFLARLDTVQAMVWRPLRGLRENFLECPLWQAAFATPEERAPVVSNIPTLILTGGTRARRSSSAVASPPHCRTPTCSSSRARRTAGDPWGVGRRSSYSSSPIRCARPTRRVSTGFHHSSSIPGGQVLGRGMIRPRSSRLRPRSPGPQASVREPKAEP
jgi:pimeloyl-ACP methyl ester carboxylesterase